MKDSIKTRQVQIRGMHCEQCVQKIQKVLAPLAKKVEVGLNPPRATLIETTATLASINRALAKAGEYQASLLSAPTQTIKPQSWLNTYQPLLIIVAYLMGVTSLIDCIDAQFSADRWMQHFMAGFFLVFSFFKMLDIRAFAGSYAMYDLLAMRWRAYGFIYPFIELGLGIAYLAGYNPHITNLLTLIVMTFSSLGVIQAVMNKQKIRCACLGTVFNLPMSTVTIIEDLLMAGMAAWMLI